MKQKPDPEGSRPLISAGLFFPMEEEACRRETERLLSAAYAQTGTEQTKAPAAVMVPHAAWEYCGEMIARGLAAWSREEWRQTKTVLLLASVHREPEPILYYPRYSRFQTPFGELPVMPLPVELQENAPLTASNIPHDEEIALETLLAFLKLLTPDARIIPLFIGSPLAVLRKKSLPLLRQLLETLPAESTRIISSGNLSGYLPPAKAEELAVRASADPTAPPPKESCGAATAEWISRLTGRAPFLAESLVCPPDPYQKQCAVYGRWIWKEKLS